MKPAISSGPASNRLPARLRGALLAVLVFCPIGSLANADPALVERWYMALLAADRMALAELLADDARIRLDDLGIEQSKAEFLGSMEEWQIAVAGASIRHRVEAENAAAATVLVCYDFPANDLLIRETFTFAAGRIAASTQATVAETCDSW